MSVTFTTATEIGASTEQVYDCMTDLEGYGRWMNGLVRVERLTEGAFQAGTSWREVRRIMGKEAAEVFEVTEADPPHALALYVDGSKGASRRGAYHFRYHLTAGAGGPGTTLLRMDAEIDLPGVLFRLLGKLLLVPFKKAIDKDTAAMKAFLETPRVPGSG